MRSNLSMPPLLLLHACLDKGIRIYYTHEIMMHAVFRYKIFIFLVLIVIGAIALGVMRSGGVNLPQQSPSTSEGVQTATGSAVVILTENGYEPQVIKVVKGQTVTFKTTRTETFWPASDLHPTHDIYPEFDPKEPIDANKTWSFRFDKVGSWNYHDHLFPYYRGTVTVSEK